MRQMIKGNARNNLHIAPPWIADIGSAPTEDFVAATDDVASILATHAPTNENFVAASDADGGRNCTKKHRNG